MTEPIGFAVLQIIPSLEGVSDSIDKQLGGTLRASGKKGGKQFAKGVGEGVKDLERDVESASKAYEKLKDKAADALGKVRTEEAALKRLRETGASADKIVRAEERLATARRNSGRASREAEDSHSSLRRAQDALSDGTDNLGRRFGGMADLASTAGRALGAAGVIAGGAALAGVAALAAGVATAARELYDMGAEFDDVFDNIRVKTGATGPQLEALQDATERLAKSVPLSIGEIGDVVAETSRALHLTGEDLNDVAGAIADLGRLTGEDVDIRTLGKAFRGFGVDAKDQVPALDGLFRATQTTGIGVNELLATVVKGGAGLRQFGFDFGESAALAAQFEEAGLDSSKALAGMTKGLATLAKDGKTGQDALRGTVAEIKNLLASGQDAAALDLTNKLFGAKGGVQFFEAIKNGALDLDTLADSMSETGDSIAQAADDTDDWAEQWQTLKNTAQVALQPLASGVFDSINTELGNLATAVEGNQDKIILFFTGIAEAAISAGGFVVTTVADLARDLGDFIAPIGDVLGAMNKFQAWQADFRGDHDTAASLREEAEEFYSWGTGLTAFADKAEGVSENIDDFQARVKALGERVAEASKFTQELGDATATVKENGDIVLSDNSPEIIANLKEIGVTIREQDGEIIVGADTDEGKRIIQAFRDQETGVPIQTPVKPELSEADRQMQAFRDRWKNILSPAELGLPAAPGGGPPPPVPGDPASLPPGIRPPPKRATGGMVDPSGRIHGPGTGTSDSILAAVMGGDGGLIRVSALESINTAASTRANWPVIDAMNHGANLGAWFKMLPGFAGGGAISSAVGQVNEIAAHYGLELTSGRAGRESETKSFHSSGNAGDFSNGVRTDAMLAFATYMAQTYGTQLSELIYDDPRFGMEIKDGRIVDRSFYAGAGDHTNHVHVALKNTLQPSLGSQSLDYGIASMPGVGPDGQSGSYEVDAEKVRRAERKVVESDARVQEAEAKVRELEADAKESERLRVHNELENTKADAAEARYELDEARRGKFVEAKASSGSSSSGSGFSLPSTFSGFGSAIGEFAGGQIGSALEVFGVGDSPPWLQAASKFISGISVSDSAGNSIFDGGNMFGSAAPLTAVQSGGGVVPPDNAGNVHGTRAGQAPGPTYNIQARDTEDAFIRAQRLERERAAAKLSRY